MRSRLTPDEKLAKRAIAGRWCVPIKIRPSLIAVLSSIALNKRAAARARVIAVKALLSVDAINNAEARTQIMVKEHAELLAEHRLLEAEVHEIKSRHDRQTEGPSP